VIFIYVVIAILVSLNFTAYISFSESRKPLPVFMFSLLIFLFLGVMILMIQILGGVIYVVIVGVFLFWIIIKILNRLDYGEERKPIPFFGGNKIAYGYKSNCLCR